LAWNVAYGVENSTLPPIDDAQTAIEEDSTSAAAATVGDAPSIQEMQSWSFDRLEAYRKQVSKSESRARLEKLSTRDFWANRKELVEELYRARIAAEGVKKKAYNTKPKNKGGTHELYLNV
jgi:hypothetical protein